MKETKELLAAIIGFGNAIGKAQADGAVNLADLPLLMDPIMKLPAALEGTDAIPGELAALGEAERADLVAYVNTTLDIPNDEIEEKIEKALAVGLMLYDLVASFKKVEAPAE